MWAIYRELFVLFFSLPRRRKLVFSLLPLSREVWAKGHHSASSSAHEKLSVSPSFIVRSKMMNPCQLRRHYCVPDPDLSVKGQNSQISINTESHDTKDTKELERWSCKLCSVTLSNISPLWQGCQILFCADLSTPLSVSGLKYLRKTVAALFRPIHNEYTGWIS